MCNCICQRWQRSDSIMRPLHLMVTTAAAALPMASSAIEMGAAASHSNGENAGGIATNAVPAGGGGQRHKRARQMNQPTGPTDPAGPYEPVRSPYHIVSHALVFLGVFWPLCLNQFNLMNPSSTRPYIHVDHRRWIDGISIACVSIRIQPHSV